ncbi:MAG: Dam family site-specific DNA-(adenine-N6)-methyltransferase [Clostridia bacterium]|nr:Dam family site-specific DNA-(adenine-N6)-methyltransferase [Clostridia bacterium]
MQYMTAKEAADKWNISQRRVSILCAENRIPDVAMLGRMWIIPLDAEKPLDARMKRNESEKEVVRPFVKWAGGKGQLLDVLKKNLPMGLGKTVTKYAEPFVGGGALLFALLNQYHFESVFINDNNKELMNAYTVIKVRCLELFDELEILQNEYSSLLTEGRQQYFYQKREQFNSLILGESTAVEKAALFIFLNRTCFNGLYRVNKMGHFNVPAGKYKNPLIYDKENLLGLSEVLQSVTILSGDYRALENYIDHDTFVYFDPPYRPLNATSGFTSYTEDQFSDKDQIALASFYRVLSEKGAKVMLSNSDPKNTNPDDNFFDDLYEGFSIQRINASRMINSKADKRGNITELLIKNY